MPDNDSEDKIAVPLDPPPQVDQDKKTPGNSVPPLIGDRRYPNLGFDGHPKGDEADINQLLRAHPSVTLHSPYLLMAPLMMLLIIIAGMTGYFLGRQGREAQEEKAAVTVSPSPVLSPSPVVLPSPILTGAKIGESVVLASGLTMVVNRFWLDSAFLRNKNSPSDKAQVNVELTFTNKEETPKSYAPTFLLLVDSKQIEYQPVFGVSKEYKSLPGGVLLAGETVKGGASFITARGEKNFQLIYENASIQFALP